jgi:SAM-dependent methyltransferase
MTDWEAHYQAADTPWEKGEASPALLEALKTVPVRGRVLAPGCGLGHDVRALAAVAEEALGLDFAPSAIAAAQATPGPANARFALADLFALPVAMRGTFDWVWEHTCFCAIDPALRPAYVETVAGALRPGGQFLGVFYLDPGQALATDGPPFESRLGELDAQFGDRFELVREWSPRMTYPNRAGREWMRWLKLRA